MKLTLPQQDIYFEQLLFPDEPIYNIGAKISIEGSLNKDIFEQAYVALIQQHDAYRCFLKGDLDNTEMLLTTEIRPLEYVDFSNKESKEVSVLEFIQKEFKKPFDIENDKFLYRFVLIKVDEKFHYLFSVYHHMITDGWGTSLMFSRLVKNYNEVLENGIVITEYPYSYENFISEDGNYFISEEFNSDKKYWTEKFKTLPENLFQKLDSSKTTNTSSRKEFIIKRTEYNELTKLALETKSSTFHIILAILYAYFGKKSQNELVSIGLPVLNRSGAKFKKTVGLFMGVNPLLISIDEENTFVELVDKIKNQLKQDYRHQRFPLGQLVNALGVFNEKGRIFNITLSYEKQDYSSHFKDTTTKVVPLSHESERVALALYVREFDETEDVKIDFDYNLNYFTQESINKVTEYVQTLMEEILNNPNRKIKVLDYLTSSERHQLLEEFNDTKVDYTSDKTIVELFEEQVDKTLENEAVQDSKIKLTYRELKEKSDSVAKYLVSNLGENNEPVGVLVDRSSELLVLLLGILKSGKCYIPIDPMLPKERIEYIIDHSQASVIITEEAFLQEFNSIKTADNNKSTANFITKDKLLQFENTQEADINNIPKPDDTAYIIYTSGSTGNPKGVEIGHHALTNFLTSIQNQLKVQSQDILYSVTTYSFDISILEFFTPLISGASVFIAGKETLNNAEQLKAELENINPTIIQATPSFYQMLFNAGWKGNKDLKILCGGDSLNESLAEKLLNHSKEVWNMYGPTETTIWSSAKKIEKPSDASNIGKPINNTQIYIVDKHHNLLPQNTVGRIFIAGEGLAKGYYKNEFLTQDKFINNPFSTAEKDNLKMYETGDLGKWNKEGEIEFLGRNDFQVKVRGFRIELGEIETKLQEYLDIKQVVADAKEVNGEKVLVAYYTKDNETNIDKTGLREYLQNKLPEYMVPGFFVELDFIPLTPNGKLDRKALPSVTDEDLIRREYVAPRNQTEQKLSEIWQEVLGVDKVGITDNFFELGGHSLAAGKIMNTIAKELNKEVSLKHIFQNQTIENLVKFLADDSKEKKSIFKAEEKEFYALTPDQMNIWLASQKEELSNAYNMYSVFEVEGNFDNLLLEKSINRIIRENEILRTNFIEKEGGIFQLIKKELSFEIDSIDTAEADFISRIENYVSKNFNLERDLLLKTAIINCNEKKYLVFLTHHIIVDGMSLEIILNKLIEIYVGGKSEKSTNNIQFKDYSEWLLTKNNRSKENIHKFQWDINVKTKVLGNIQANGTIKNTSFQLSQEEYAQLKEISSLNKVTTFSAILTLLSVVLNKIYQQSSICLGTVFSGRNNMQLEDAIGMFIKSLPLNLRINEKANFGSLAKINQDSLIALEERMNLPFIGNLNELTDFLVIYQHSDTLSKKEIDFGTFKLKKQKVYSTQSRFPMVFNFFESEGLKCEVEYNESVDYKIIELIWNKILVLIDWAFENPDQANMETELLTAPERQLKSSVDIDFDF